MYQGKTREQKSVAKLSVERIRQGWTDHIIHSVEPDAEADYMGIRFKGTYTVVSLDGEKPQSIYIGDGTSFRMRNLEVTSASGEPFNACFEWQDGGWSYTSDKELTIITPYQLRRNDLRK